MCTHLELEGEGGRGSSDRSREGGTARGREERKRKEGWMGGRPGGGMEGGYTLHLLSGNIS